MVQAVTANDDRISTDMSGWLIRLFASPRSDAAHGELDSSVPVDQAHQTPLANGSATDGVPITSKTSADHPHPGTSPTASENVEQQPSTVQEGQDKNPCRHTHCGAMCTIQMSTYKVHGHGNSCFVSVRLSCLCNAFALSDLTNNAFG